jgi:hypothetical protein
LTYSSSSASLSINQKLQRLGEFNLKAGTPRDNIMNPKGETTIKLGKNIENHQFEERQSSIMVHMVNDKIQSESLVYQRAILNDDEEQIISHGS